AQLEADEDLASLRERDDFRALVAAMRARTFEVQPTRGFRGIYAWGADGEPTDAPGPHYLTSVVLGVTSGRGNSVREVTDCLRRAASADGTRPDGVICYMVNGDVRSRTRQWEFATALRALTELGVRAQTVEGKLPSGLPDVAGVMAGSATLAWDKSHSTLLPGSIAEHLTSCGGMMYDGASQTPISHFIAEGAAGSAGTVNEPYAIQAKFPDPFLQVHYARGCTLAEAFYQSVRGPYQLLIIGDPLCRPWANIPQVTADGVVDGATVRGTLELTPGVAGDVTGGMTGGVEVASYELLADGRLVATVPAGQGWRLDSTELSDGWHELRIVAVGAGLIESHGELALGVTVANAGRSVRLDAAAEELAWGEELHLQARADGASAIEVLHNARTVARIEVPAGEVRVDSRELGLGPVTLQARATWGLGAEAATATSAPLHLLVRVPAGLPAQPLDPAAWAEGLELTVAGAAPVTVPSTLDKDWLSKAGVQEGQAFTLTGCFVVAAEDLYQFQVRSPQPLTLSVDGGELAQLRGGEGMVVVPVALAAGAHRVEVATVAAASRPTIAFGGPGCLHLRAPYFNHPRRADEPPQQTQ
ncbi:MAG TPA: hypothetical protein VM283_07355, partial [Armatimonadota bacterium]|nr:hypothetical protein [Armatimonadota bacterium]